MEMVQRVIVLSARPVDMKDPDTDEPIQGVSVSYLYGDDLKPIVDRDGNIGQRPAKRFFPLSFWGSGHLIDAPALYDGVFVATVDSKGKVALQLNDLKYISGVQILPVAPTPEPDAVPATTHEKGGGK